MEIAVIAATAVAQILVPYLKRRAAGLAEDLADRVSDAAADHATGVAETLWERIRAKFSDSEPDRNVVKRFEEEPEAAAPLLEIDLKRKLADDPDFAQELADLIASESPDGSGNTIQIFGEGGVVDARGAEISGGVVAGYIRNVSAADPRPPSNDPR
jgi:hypothetical protein